MDRIINSSMIHSFSDKVLEKFMRVAKEKGRSTTPWKDYCDRQLMMRLLEEVSELQEALLKGAPVELMDECIDVAAFAWFIYEQEREAEEFWDH